MITLYELITSLPFYLIYILIGTALFIGDVVFSKLRWEAFNGYGWVFTYIIIIHIYPVLLIDVARWVIKQFRKYGKDSRPL